MCSPSRSCQHGHAYGWKVRYFQASPDNTVLTSRCRFVAGAAVGMLTSTIPMYAAEISESKYRGALSGALQWFLSWGFFAAQWIGYGCQHVKGPFSCKQDSNIGAPSQNTNAKNRAFPSCFPVHSRRHSGLWYLVPARESSLAVRERQMGRGQSCSAKAPPRRNCGD